MQSRPTLFFDFDDTLSDPIPFFLQFARAFGAGLCARFGGETEAWEKATADMLIAVEDDYKQRFVGQPTNGYCNWLNGLHHRGMQQVFDAMHCPLPDDVERLAAETQFRALSQCNAAFPGATEALQALAGQGYPMHMASGQESRYLRDGLTGMGLVTYFGQLYGPDLVDCAKEGPEYYQRVFDSAGVESNEAIIIDDYPPAIGWAVEVGAKVIQAKLTPVRDEETQSGVVAVVTDLHHLPHLIAYIVGD